MTIGLSDELFFGIQALFIPGQLCLIPSLTVQGASRLLNQEIFHLLIIDLEYLRNIGQSEWLTGVRRITFVPVIVLSDTPEQDMHTMVQLGADICISAKQPRSVVADLIFAQLRRYTEYNHYLTPSGVASAAFQVGDILIDPARRAVEVRGQPVNLRPREFSLLLFFMQNPNIVLTSEQICDQAWGMEGGYNRGISQPIYLLRQAIEPDPDHPTYIQTVYRAGYRFTAKRVETCDICENGVSVL